MMTRSITLIAATLFSISALADTIALKCDFPENISFDVTLNESANSAVMRVSGGRTLDVVSVAFNPAEVNIVLNGKGNARLFDIDRTTLGITQNITFIKSITKGQCALIEVPKDRKF